jgi:predicted enzyme related to lactoylglutathione lyase
VPRLTTAEHIDAVAQRIKDAGGTLESEPQDVAPGVRGFRIKDPDGFRLAMTTERP